LKLLPCLSKHMLLGLMQGRTIFFLKLMPLWRRCAGWI
jgi:hypothetical protein